MSRSLDPKPSRVGMTGFIVANSIAGALANHPKQAGAVSALMGACHYGSGILGSMLVGVLSNGTPWPLELVVVLCGVGAAICAWVFLPSQTIQQAG